MHGIRKALLQTLVWMTSAATLLAGTPQVRCVCPSGAVKAICLAPAAVEKPCCCCVVAEDDAPPSCCAQPASPDESGNPAIGHDRCHKAMIAPAAATFEKAKAESQEIVAEPLAALETQAGSNLVTVPAPSFDTDRLPPPIDLHLVLQHFLI